MKLLRAWCYSTFSRRDRRCQTKERTDRIAIVYTAIYHICTAQRGSLIKFCSNTATKFDYKRLQGEND